jgi:ketosteroid isomerase-like protein
MEEVNMTPQEEMNQTIVLDVYSAVGSGDLDRAKSYLDDHVEIREAESLPYGGLYRGKEEVAACFDKVFKFWKINDFKLRQVVAGGDIVAVHLDMDVSANSNGAHIKYDLLEVWRLQDGKIVEILPFYEDTHAIWTAFH